MQSVVTIARQQRKHSCFLHSPWRGTAMVIYPSKGIKCHRKIILKQIAFYNFEHTWWKTQKFPRNGRRIGWELGLVDLTLFKSKMAGQIIWYNNNCIISTQAFVWVIFFKKATEAFRYPALLTVDGWFHFFSFKGLGKSDTSHWSSYLFVLSMYVSSCSFADGYLQQLFRLLQGQTKIIF